MSGGGIPFEEVEAAVLSGGMSHAAHREVVECDAAEALAPYRGKGVHLQEMYRHHAVDEVQALGGVLQGAYVAEAAIVRGKGDSRHVEDRLPAKKGKALFEAKNGGVLLAADAVGIFTIKAIEGPPAVGEAAADLAALSTEGFGIETTCLAGCRNRSLILTSISWRFS